MNVLCHLHIKDNKKTTCRVRDKQFWNQNQNFGKSIKNIKNFQEYQFSNYFLVKADNLD